jgi:hypothetical protein
VALLHGAEERPLLVWPPEVLMRRELEGIADPHDRRLATFFET